MQMIGARPLNLGRLLDCRVAKPGELVERQEKLPRRREATTTRASKMLATSAAEVLLPAIISVAHPSLAQEIQAASSLPVL